MTRRSLVAPMIALALIGLAISASAQSQTGNPQGTREDGSQLISGPAQVVYGALQVILGEGAAVETRYQPDSRQLSIKTMQGEARVVTSAKNLIMVENIGGKTEIKLPSGRVINVEPGRTEIVGQAMVDDPGQIVIRFAGIGPLAQGGPGMPAGTTTQATVTVLLFSNPAVLGTIIDPFLPFTYSRTDGVSCSTPGCR